jgi:hypothetical protein
MRGGIAKHLLPEPWRFQIFKTALDMGRSCRIMNIKSSVNKYSCGGKQEETP